LPESRSDNSASLFALWPSPIVAIGPIWHRSDSGFATVNRPSASAPSLPVAWTARPCLTYGSPQFVGATIGAGILFSHLPAAKADYDVAINGLARTGWGPGYLGEYTRQAAIVFEIVATFLFLVRDPRFDAKTGARPPWQACRSAWRWTGDPTSVGIQVETGVVGQSGAQLRSGAICRRHAIVTALGSSSSPPRWRRLGRNEIAGWAFSTREGPPTVSGLGGSTRPRSSRRRMIATQSRRPPSCQSRTRPSWRHAANCPAGPELDLLGEVGCRKGTRSCHRRRQRARQQDPR